MDLKFEQYPCSLCKADNTDFLFEKHGFSVVQCKHCQFVYVNPRVSNHQLEEIYEHDYFANKNYGYVGYEQEKRLRVKNFQRWLKDAAPYISKYDDKVINALDIGCAAGYCLEVMKAENWNTDGLELDERMCRDLKSAGHNIFQIHLENFQSEKKYHVITLFDVIEHIPDLDPAFSQLQNLLDDKGVVVMVTPDHNSMQRKLFGRNWFQYKPIEHIQYFTKDSLIAFAERNGLKMVYHIRGGQYADTEFIINRLNYYHFSFLSKLFTRFFSVFNIRNRFFYVDTGSIYAIFQKK